MVLPCGWAEIGLVSEINTVQIVARINGGDILFNVSEVEDEMRVKGN
jgi:hypothetical protein